MSKKTKVLMVQGTMSGVGKSLTAAGLCRIFTQDGYRVAPFKSQNMSLNSFVTEEGLEMGRAQVMQAEACRIKPSVYMNPILLKPNSDRGSQVIVNGRVLGNMDAVDYFSYKTKLIPHIQAAFEELEKEADLIVIEGAGSPAEINLKENDIVNMGLAELVDAPVLLVGDIDRGGVFAQLIGTADLLEEGERARIKGFVINKFRGDVKLLEPGLRMIEEKSGIPVLGVLPFLKLGLEDEDSLTEKFTKSREAEIRIGVVRLPHISNFTDFDVFGQLPEVDIRYISGPRLSADMDMTNVPCTGNFLADVDMLILPGSKNTIADMRYLWESGLASEIRSYAEKGNPVFGICGGYQMLGQKISDPHGEEEGGEIAGLGLLPVETVIEREKFRKQTAGRIIDCEGLFAGLKGLCFEGYEIHMGQTFPAETCRDRSTQVGDLLKEERSTDTSCGKMDAGNCSIRNFTPQQTGYCLGNVYGTYIHGIFDRKAISLEILRVLSTRKGKTFSGSGMLAFADFKEKEYDRLADALRESLDMEAIYRIMGMDAAI